MWPGAWAGRSAAALAAFVHERTEGNALFMVNIVEHLVQQGLVVRQAGAVDAAGRGRGHHGAVCRRGCGSCCCGASRPSRPRRGRCWKSPVWSGEEFAVAAVAAGVQCPWKRSRRSVKRWRRSTTSSTTPGWRYGRMAPAAGSYRFQHALYQQVLYEQIGTARRMQLHRRIGRRLEAGYGARAGEIAAQLALHFERGGEIEHAVHYLAAGGGQCRPAQCPSRSDHRPGGCTVKCVTGYLQ